MELKTTVHQYQSHNLQYERQSSNTTRRRGGKYHLPGKYHQ
ncbi:unnamed protein product [Schistosoma curassoni]|uniref:Uncharacterized protein n=1 Tax=Schistosoma curassoni TaxID=6186 RepID=A0A183K5B8_9TREM|nr:unnamed protein product [Schistosoma curassoni]